MLVRRLVQNLQLDWRVDLVESLGKFLAQLVRPRISEQDGIKTGIGKSWNDYGKSALFESLKLSICSNSPVGEGSWDELEWYPDPNIVVRRIRRIRFREPPGISELLSP